jgi:hypothetical protein
MVWIGTLCGGGNWVFCVKPEGGVQTVFSGCEWFYEEFKPTPDGGRQMRRLFLTLALAGCFALAVSASASAVMILNEWVSNDVSTDDHEFIELHGTPGTDMTNYHIVVIEGEGSGAGVIDRIYDLVGLMPADGYYVIGDPAVSPDLEKTTTLENGGNNIILVYGDVLQAIGFDVDPDDDCVEDYPIGNVVDAVGYGYGYSGADCITYYGATPVGPDGTYDPAGGARCPDCVGNWEMICLNATEPPPTGSDCVVPDEYLVYRATPGSCNACFEPTAAEPMSWGSAKALFR